MLELILSYLRVSLCFFHSLEINFNDAWRFFWSYYLNIIHQSKFLHWASSGNSLQVIEQKKIKKKLFIFILIFSLFLSVLNQSYWCFCYFDISKRDEWNKYHVRNIFFYYFILNFLTFFLLKLRMTKIFKHLLLNCVFIRKD